MQSILYCRAWDVHMGNYMEISASNCMQVAERFRIGTMDKNSLPVEVTSLITCIENFFAMILQLMLAGF